VGTDAKLPLLRADVPARPAFTGERFVPGLAGAHIAYEHLHRYAFARRFVRGRRVLDLGCGLGYGAEVLAPLARDVVALDRDRDAIRHARASRTHALGPFVLADATSLPFRDASFDVVIAYELIEHLTDQEALVAEIRRVLPPAGLLLISSPDKDVYSGKLGQRNPFHPKELTTEELLRVLRPHFERVAVYKQRVVEGSVLMPEPTSGADGVQLVLARLEADPPSLVLDPSEPDFVYNVAVCGPAAALGDAPRGEILADVAERLTVEYEHSLQTIGEVVRGLERSVREWEAYAAQIVRDKDAYLEQFVKAKDEVIASLEQQVRDGQAAAATLAETVASREAALAALDERLRAVEDALAKAVTSTAEAARLRADVARLEREIGTYRQREADLESELGSYRDDPIIRRYLALRRLMRGGPLPSRGGA
jgi:Methyltransferase domain